MCFKVLIDSQDGPPNLNLDSADRESLSTVRWWIVRRRSFPGDVKDLSLVAYLILLCLNGGTNTLSNFTAQPARRRRSMREKVWIYGGPSEAV
ncbi:hypothetical protein SUGI_0828190 [Cryptomeria japonica]|nr:hypothetical protein SUGI_0828190 [Cryptomeria japonica]